MTTLDEAIGRIRVARTRDELFGAGGAREYRALAKLVHPDRVPPERVREATDAFARLGALWSGRAGRLLSSRRATYRLGDPAGHDEIADYVHAKSDVDVLLKVAHRPTDNDLLEREATTLRGVIQATDARHRPYLPELRESFTYRDQHTGADRAVNVFTAVPGLVSLADVRAAFPSGLDGRDVAWIWRRLLVALGLAHRAGVLHGAVVPDHILIDSSEHGLVLTNWCYASAGDPIPAVLRRYRDWYAPEIAARARPTFGTDIYLATKCMVALLDANAPAALTQFARGCLLPAATARPDDAWSLLAELDEVLARTYGPRRFRSWPTTKGNRR
jgi:serine/threonine protein kinase